MGGQSGAGREQGTVEEGVVSKMLVAYSPCGCRVMALLDATDEIGAEEFRVEAEESLLSVREEEHERIGALACQQHGGLAHVWDQGPMAYYCKRCGEVCAEEPPPRSGCKVGRG